MVGLATGIWSVNCAFLILGEYVFLLPFTTNWNTFLGVSRVKKIQLLVFMAFLTYPSIGSRRVGQFHWFLRGDSLPVYQNHHDRRVYYGSPLAYRHARWPRPPWLSQTGYIGYGTFFVEPGGKYMILASRTTLNSSLTPP